jgi:hypothetical protein
MKTRTRVPEYERLEFNVGPGEHAKIPFSGLAVQMEIAAFTETSDEDDYAYHQLDVLFWREGARSDQGNRYDGYYGGRPSCTVNVEKNTVVPHHTSTIDLTNGPIDAISLTNHFDYDLHFMVRVIFLPPSAPEIDFSPMVQAQAEMAAYTREVACLRGDLLNLQNMITELNGSIADMFAEVRRVAEVQEKAGSGLFAGGRAVTNGGKKA